MLRNLTKTTSKLLLAGVLSNLVCADTQAQDVDFFKTNYTPMRSQAYSITKAPGGSVYFSGYSCLNANCMSVDALLVKTTAGGDTLWTKTFGTPTHTDQAFKVLMAGPDRLLVCGASHNEPEGDAFLHLLDTNGNVVWEKSYSLPDMRTALVDMKLLSDGIVLCGTITDVATENTDAWLMKTDLNGNLLWHKSYGGENYDDSWQIEHTAEGGFLLAGGSYTYRTGSRHDDAWLIKTDSLGETLWIKNHGNADTIDWIWSIASVGNELAPEGYIFTGVKNRDADNFISHLFLARVDTSGDIVWEIPVTAATGFIEGLVVEQAPDGTFFVLGSELTETPPGIPLVLFHLTADGVMLDTFRYAPADGDFVTPRGMCMDGESAIYVTGRHVSATSEFRPFLAHISGLSHAPVSIGRGSSSQPAAVTLSPNPATDAATISCKEPMQRMLLRSPNGQVVRDWQCNGKQTETLSLTGIPKGIYFLTVYTASGGTDTQKLLIR